MGHHGQRLFLTWARPLAPLLVLLAYGGVWLFERTDELLQIMALLALSVVLGTGYALASRRAPADRVLRVALPLDTLLIAGMTVALERPDVLAIAYFWSVALAALFLTPRVTVANTALAALCALVVPFAAPFDRSVAVVATDVIVLLLIGGLLALFSRHALEAQEALARERALDERALAITQRVRSTLELDEVLNATLREIGTTLDAERAILRLRRGP